MDFDNYLHLETETYMSNEDTDPPKGWSHICHIGNFDGPDYHQLTLKTWLDDRATEMLGYDAEYLDTGSLVSYWVENQLVEIHEDEWFFTRDKEAKIWLPR